MQANKSIYFCSAMRWQEICLICDFLTGSRSRRCLISQTIHVICQIQNSKFQQIMGTVSSNCQQTCSKGLKQLQKCCVLTTENQSWSSHTITEESLTLWCDNYIHLLHYFFITFNLFLNIFFLFYITPHHYTS